MDLLRDGIRTLPSALQQEIQERLRAMPSTPPIVCPFLDADSHSCLVYEYRPTACRTYGFYVERDLGLYCREIEVMVEKGECRDIVWGNACAIGSDDRLQPVGELIAPLVNFHEEL
jgi:Fe-S-cluster containining protein